jgi:hypothetical protein
MLFHYSRFSQFIRRWRIIYTHLVCLKQKYSYDFVFEPAGSSLSVLGVVFKYWTLESLYIDHISRTISFENVMPLYYNAYSAKMCCNLFPHWFLGLKLIGFTEIKYFKYLENNTLRSSSCDITTCGAYSIISVIMKKYVIYVIYVIFPRIFALHLKD